MYRAHNIVHLHFFRAVDGRRPYAESVSSMKDSIVNYSIEPLLQLQ